MNEGLAPTEFASIPAARLERPAQLPFSVRVRGESARASPDWMLVWDTPVHQAKTAQRAAM